MSDLERLSTTSWERSDRLFLEMGKLDRTPTGFRLSGTALYRGRGGPTSATYLVETDASRRSRSVRIEVDEPTGLRTLALHADDEGRWHSADGALDLPFPCEDVDLAVTPATNGLTIRRLDLAVGAEATARVLWIQVPSFGVRAVEQGYQRIDRDTYRYKGRYGSYKLTVDANGMVLDYPGGGWRSVAHKVSRRMS
ncbi:MULTISPECIES: putative glycolipid-binding domain-containing protein [unclassified Micromonospora]|uniref:putative glycolipid-binding domain-containing protein n=1 Tax=unclassified Micromonospora TaxID=2617518 RepID=UPI0022B63C55|nr:MULTISPECIES: putative glycolipid-binding domain-containing protein [unclassified Micromonospora]MCZ7422892.1 putative glycolipid-binding domain-containing protein [Verrucosispora sp. WMMA2121]WBB90623.1 putative glycolipid-binding domain-containing protein [Verrucosispora sp. WMMC514]